VKKKGPQQQVEVTGQLRAGGREDVLFSKSLTITAILFIAGYAYSTLFPSAFNWGLHPLAFMPDAVKIIVLISMVALLFPKVQSWVLSITESIVSSIPKLSRTQNIFLGLVGATIAGLFFWFGREQYYFLGDGYLLTRKIQLMKGLENIPEFYPNEPLAGLIFYYVRQFLVSFGYAEHGEYPFQVVSVISGIGFIICTGLLANALGKTRIQKTLIFLFMFASGVSQLFFGYVEMYALSAFLLSLFLLLSVQFLKEKISIVFPAFVFALLIVAHLAMISLLPAVMLLVMYSKRRKILNLLLAGITIGGIVFLVFILSKFDWMTFYSAFLSGKSHVLSMSDPPPAGQTYSLFSLIHASELSQLYLLLCPFALVLLFSSFIIFRKTVEWGDTILQFLILVTLCGAGVSLLINPELGLSRDWDAFSPLFLGLIFTSGLVSICHIPMNTKVRKSIIMVLGITILQMLTWISLNASDSESINRFQSLAHEKVWSKNATLSAYEEFAIFYRARADGPNSVTWYKNYLAVDSTNPRIWGSMGYVYQLMGDEKNKIEAYSGASRHGSIDFNLLTDLGVMQLKYRKYKEAISALEQALRLDSTLAEPTFYLGIAYYSDQKSEKALTYLKKAISLSPTYLNSYLAAIKIYLLNNDLMSARRVFERYLRYAPPHSLQTDSLRKRLGY